jgi:NAD(P)H dehydrogenase (quinone)
MTLKSQATRKQFLIAGGTGSTGRSAVKILMEQGYSVRVFVHSEDERSANLRIQGADIVVGDLLNLDDTRNALEGVGAAYFVYPISPGLVEATAYFAQAAKEAGVGSIVNMSQISARREGERRKALNVIGGRQRDFIGRRQEKPKRSSAASLGWQGTARETVSSPL